MTEECLNANDVYGIRKGSDKRKFAKLFVNIKYSRLLRPNEKDEIKTLRLGRCGLAQLSQNFG